MREFDAELMHSFAQFRQDLRQILYEHGVLSNPGWTEEDIVRAFRQLLQDKDKTASEIYRRHT